MKMLTLSKRERPYGLSDENYIYKTMITDAYGRKVEIGDEIFTYRGDLLIVEHIEEPYFLYEYKKYTTIQGKWQSVKCLRRKNAREIRFIIKKYNEI